MCIFFFSVFSSFCQINQVTNNLKRFFSDYFSYHHTVSSTLLYGLRESLSLICKEGLANVIERHQRAAKTLHSGLVELGLQLYVKDANNRLPTINAVKIPREYDWMKIVEIAANKYVVSNSLKRMFSNLRC